MKDQLPNKGKNILEVVHNPPIVLWHVEGEGISYIARNFSELMNNLKSEEEAMKELENLRNQKNKTS